MYKPGQSYYSQFPTHDVATGSHDADTLPIATATINGIDDAGFVLTVAKIDTGRYKITGTIPLTYTVDDAVQISVAATVNGISGKAIIDSFIIEEESGANEVTITVEEADHTPIPDVSVLVFNSAETVKPNSGMTDVNGLLAIALNDGSYKIRLNKAMVNFTVPETLTVSGVTAKTCVGTPVSFTAPSAGLQTILIYPTDLGFVYSPTMVFTAVISAVNTCVDGAILTNQILKAIDKGDHFEMQIAKGAKVKITGKNKAANFFEKEITVTDANSRGLAEYLLP